MSDLLRLSDDVLLTRLQKAAFSYFLDYADPQTGLVADTSRKGSPCSIAVVGFALSCYPIGVANGWLTRADAAARTLKVLSFFLKSVQNDAADATGYKGFYYHFLDMQTGKRVWQCELSLIDTALLIAGILVAAAYFDRGDDAEAQIRDCADRLYRRVEWHWAETGSATLAQGWKPECGFLNYGWEGYNEATILYILGLGSPTFPLAAHGYEAGASPISGRTCFRRMFFIPGRCSRISSRMPGSIFAASRTTSCAKREPTIFPTRKARSQCTANTAGATVTTLVAMARISGA